MSTPSKPRWLPSLFTGSEEIERAVTLVGWVAINHVKVEEALGYLVWQLEAFDISRRNKWRNKPAPELQTVLRQERQRLRGQLIAHRLRSVDGHLNQSRVAKRLNELPEGARFRKEWEQLRIRIGDLSKARNLVIHSAVAWAAGLVRVSSGLDGETLPLDLPRDQQLASNLGNLATELGQFTTELGFSLPFAGDDKIITFRTLNINLSNPPSPVAD